MLKSDFGRYKIEKWVGGGAFSDIYLATDKILDEKVALKIPKLKYIKQKDVIKEAKMLLKANHPLIVRFFQLEIIENLPVIVMEYVKGNTLRERIKEKKITPSDAVYFAIQILEAVEYLHNMNILHRDLKPENIFIERNKIKLGDLGISIITKDALKDKVKIKGTLNYMAPESFKGEYFFTSDIWSVGLILYEMLTHSHPYAGIEIDDYYKFHKKGKIFDFKTIPSPFIPVLKKALNFDPTLRYQTARAFIKDLMLLTEGKQISLFPEVKEIDYLSALTDTQKEAVFSDEKVTLLLGIAGSGKTTVLGRKIAYLLKEKNVMPENIVALTFTSKAAIEMKSRIKLYTGKDFFNLFIGTFHNFCNSILRNEIYLLGFKEDYKLASFYSKIKILSNLAPEIALKYNYNFNIDTISRIEKEISSLKSNMITPEEFNEKANTKRRKFIAELYKKYFEELHRKNKLDFDDLIYYTVKLFNENPDILQKYQMRYKYIFVDEFQDINEAQFRLIKLLNGKNNFLFVTGDDDQIIYGFRGSSSKYIKNFTEYFSQSKIIKLEENFRSNAKIFNKAARLISYNRDRIPKSFVAKNLEGDDVKFHTFTTRREEARFVAHKISEFVRKEHLSYNDFAVLFRMNYQSQIFEKYFQDYGIPYNLVSLEPFFQRREIEGLINLLKLSIQHLPDIDTLNPAINFPAKTLNAETTKILNQICKKARTRDELFNFIKTDRTLPQKVKSKIKKIEKVLSDTDLKLLSLIERIFEEYKIEKTIKKTKRISYLNSFLNIKEFYNIAKNFVETYNSEKIEEFLDYISLQQSADFLKSAENSVKLLTVHSAKGLQFNTVFIADLVEGIFPHNLSMDSVNALEEERRLMFVAITRAEQRLYLLSALEGYKDVSRFIFEMNV